MKHLVRFAPTLLWMAVIVYWSSQSDLPIDHPPISTWFGGAQHRLAHIAAFAVLAAFVRFAFGSMSRASLGSWLLVVGFAMTDEWHQSLTPGRQVGVDDVLVDSAAGLVALLVVHAVHALPPGLPDGAGWRSPLLARSVLVALFVVAITPAAAPGLHLAGHVSRSIVSAADQKLSTPVERPLVRLLAAGDRLTTQAWVRSAAVIDRIHRHLAAS